MIVILIALIVVMIGIRIIIRRYCEREMNHWFRPLSSIAEKVTEIAQGNLDVAFNEEPLAEEIAMLTVSLNDTVEQLVTMVGIPYVSWKARTKWSELALDAEYGE